MVQCDACGDPITEENGLKGEPLKAERDGEVFTFCVGCDGYKTLRVPTADWVLAQRQRKEADRTWGDQIVRSGGKMEITPAPHPNLEAIQNSIGQLVDMFEAEKSDFPTADVKEAVREVLREGIR